MLLLIIIAVGFVLVIWLLTTIQKNLVEFVDAHLQRLSQIDKALEQIEQNIRSLKSSEQSRDWSAY